MKKCLIYAAEAPNNFIVDMLDVVRQIYSHEPVETVALIINRPYNELSGFFDAIITVDDNSVNLYNQKIISHLVQQLETKWQFDSILIPATQFGRMLAPRVAMGLHVGLVADVTAIKNDEQGLKMIRPAYSGRMLAEITTAGKRPYMMSIRQGVFSYEGSKEKQTTIVNFFPESQEPDRLKIIRKKNKPSSYDIRESDILISGGGGMVKNFDQLELLADELGGQVSASRKAVDSKIAPRSIQVGQSGKTVSPRLYMAFGIHGAIQHVEGLRNVETIIAVNTNKNAPICSLADIVVEGDGTNFLNKLVEKIRKEKN